MSAWNPATWKTGVWLSSVWDCGATPPPSDKLEVSNYIHAWNNRTDLYNASPISGYLRIGHRLSRRR